MIKNDDFLSQNEIQTFKDAVSGPNFPWFYQSFGSISANYDDVIAIDGFADYPQFTHLLCSNAIAQSQFYDAFIEEIFLKFCAAESITPRSIIRSKLNMTYPIFGIDAGPPHVDLDGEHMVFIYYFNDSDGDTIIFNRDSGNEFIEIDRVSPKAGRAIMFDGSHYHSASLPKRSLARFVMNVAFL